jgi:16S rRNA (cytosine1402-N4)-methyltransferase
MRLDRESYISAYDLVNHLSEQEISSILKSFGEERFHNRIANFLIKERTDKPLSTTQDLADTVLKAIPPRFQSHKIHPATRTFQAFRIAVNRELESLEIALEKATKFLSRKGRICVISFHSLEDRIVKEKFRVFFKDARIKIITKKPLRPTGAEIHQNLRCRSAKLRAAERI